MMMMNQVVKVRRETLAACMTCPLCNKLLKEATTISKCLHTFCRKCIYEKLTDEEEDCCPICYIDLGCVPVEKLRPDHSLQDVRAKIFPLKSRKIKAPEIVPTITLPVKRKERSLSSLVVSTPQVSSQTSSIGKRTKSIARKAAALRGSNSLIDEPIKKEEDALEVHPESSSSPKPLNKIVPNRRQSQNSSTTEPSDYTMRDKVIENDAQPSWGGMFELWKPLTCLVEAANRTKSLKLSSEGYVPKLEPENGPYSEVHVPKTKIRDLVNKPKFQDNKNNISLGNIELVQPRKIRRMSQKRDASRELGISPQSVLDAVGVKRDRRGRPVWFTLMASEDQKGAAPLPQISGCYLRIKDGNIPVSFILTYIMKKLGLTSESEVEIRCRGHPVVPTLQLHNLVDLWLQTGSQSQSQGMPVSVGTSAKDFIMVLDYSRKIQST